jgi:hypothetical protein
VNGSFSLLFAARNIFLNNKYYGRNKGLNPSLPIKPEFPRSDAKTIINYPSIFATIIGNVILIKFQKEPVSFTMSNYTMAPSGTGITYCYYPFCLDSCQFQVA